MSNTLEIRSRWQLSQKELSKCIGVSVRTIQGWDSRNTLPEWNVKCIEARLRELWHYYNIYQEELEKYEYLDFADYCEMYHKVFVE